MRHSRSTIEHRRAAKRGETQPAAVLEARPRTFADAATPLTPVMDDPIEALLVELKTTLGGLRRRTDADPLSNPLQLLALAIKDKVDAGALSLAVIEQLIQRLSVEAFERRAERLRRYLGETDRDANLRRLRALIQDLTRDAERAQPVSFEEFRRRIERPRFGVVFTAHPTFGLARALQQALVELALRVTADGQPLDAERRQALLSRLAQSEHRPDQPLDLDEEHGQSLNAITNLHAAIDRLCGLVLDVAREVYPERWTELNPNLVTMASWVGYDLDGRSDIPWTASLAKRLRLQAIQLEHCRGEAGRLRALVEHGSALGDVLDLLDARLTLALKQAQEDVAVFGPKAASDPESFRSELATSDARRRLNARQLHNAIRKTIGMDHPPDDPSHRITYLNAISALIDGVMPVQINFGSLAAEKATAKRLFMILAQTLKYVDASQPIRFLIAECETGFTLLTALYFAKLFGVED